MARRKVATLLVTTLVFVCFGAGSAVAQTAITVDTTDMTVDFGGAQQVGDLPGPNGQVSLREATIASTNTSGAETITFDIPTTDPGFNGNEFVIAFDPPTRDDSLTLGDDGTTLDATTQPGGFDIVLEGGGDDTGLRINASSTSVVGLTVRTYGQGIFMEGADNTISDSIFTDNRVGVIADGSGQLIESNSFTANLSAGINLDAGTGSLVTGNTISGNGNMGMTVEQNATVSNNTLANNGQAGIWVFAGVGTISGNVISGNAEEGVRPDSFGGSFETHYTISQNSISGNGELGIDLEGLGVTKNDGSDKDLGANDLLNFPDLKSATDTGTETVVEGRLKIDSPQLSTIEFFANETADPSGFGEGEVFLGSAQPDAKGKITVVLDGGMAGQFITATVTDEAGNTSEFSEAVPVEPAK